MRKTLVGLLAAATAVIGLSSAPARADVMYIDSDGVMHSISNDLMLPSSTIETRTLVQPAVVEPVTTQVITQPAIIDTTPVVQTSPVIMNTVRDRGHLFHLGLPFIDFSLF